MPGKSIKRQISKHNNHRTPKIPLSSFYIGSLLLGTGSGLKRGWYSSESLLEKTSFSSADSFCVRDVGLCSLTLWDWYPIRPRPCACCHSLCELMWASVVMLMVLEGTLHIRKGEKQTPTELKTLHLQWWPWYISATLAPSVWSNQISDWISDHSVRVGICPCHCSGGRESETT